MIGLCEPHLGDREREYLEQCLDQGFVSTYSGAGSFLGRFEEAMAAYLGAEHCVAVTSGSAALQLALLAAGVAPGDEVLVPALTFIAPAFAVRHAGAWPVFIDVEPDHWQMDSRAVARFLHEECRSGEEGPENLATGRRVRAIIPVDLLGHPADLDALREAAGPYKLAVIEDATESLGAEYKSRRVGMLGDAGCLSFNGNKLITAGGGGMVVTGDGALAARARHLSAQAKAGAREFVHDEIGFNHRLTNLQAAVGLAQLERIAEHLAAKAAIARRYREGLAQVPGITLPNAADWARSAWWLYTVLVDEEDYGLDSRGLMAALEEEGIVSRPLWQPLNQSPALRDCQPRRCPVAEDLSARALSLPSSVGLSESDQDRVIWRIVSLAC